MIKFSAEMYIDKIGERGPYDQKIMLRADLHDEDSKYPQHIEAVVIVGEDALRQREHRFAHGAAANDDG